MLSLQVTQLFVKPLGSVHSATPQPIASSRVVPLLLLRKWIQTLLSGIMPHPIVIPSLCPSLL